MFMMPTGLMLLRHMHLEIILILIRIGDLICCNKEEAVVKSHIFDLIFKRENVGRIAPCKFGRRGHRALS